jgi:hypothetical protein
MTMRIPRLKITLLQLCLAVGLAATGFGVVFTAEIELTCLLLVAYCLSLLTPLQRFTLRWCPSVAALCVVAISAASVDMVATMVVGCFGFVMCCSTIFCIPRSEGCRLDLRYVGLWLASLGCIISVPATLWPVRLAFASSRPDFERVAARIDSGQHVKMPQNVGGYTIIGAELRNGRPCLWTSTDPRGFEGFVRNPVGGVNRKLGRYPNTVFNLWSYTRLDLDWAFISED